MPSLDHSFFTANRDKIHDSLRGGVLVIPAYSEMQRGNDAAFKFEQESNFWYATGIEYADWWLIMDSARRKSWLVAPEVNDVHALFDGSLSFEDAKSISGATDVIDRRKAMELLKQTARKHQFVYTVDQPPHHDHFGFTLNPAAKEMRELLDRTFANVQDFRPELAKIRAIKSAVEISAIQSAIAITNHAFEIVHDTMSVYKFEYEIEALFSHEFRQVGAVGHAYDPIVAGAKNACTLHYSKNQSRLKRGTLLLMDVGARHEGYAADVTRTYAVGDPTKRQKRVHESVQQAQEQIIALLRPGMSIAHYHDEVDRIMKHALVELDLMSDTSDNDNYRKYFPHAISHGLGLDVHDSLGAPTAFVEGMVLTVEPGIYIEKESIGVRIEDDIVITATGHKNLSGKLSTGL